MSPAVRQFLAIIISCATAIGITLALEELARQVTMPPGVNAHNLDQVKFALEHGEFPLASLALVMGGWLLAAYTGSRIAASFGRSRFASLAFTVIFSAFIIRDLALQPHPAWMWIGGALGVPLLSLGAAGESITIGG